MVQRLPIVGRGALGDGSSTLAGAHLDRALAEIDAFLSDTGIGSSQPIAFECANTLTDALTLLALLRRGTSFLLVPPQASDHPRPQLPKFFAHRIWIAPIDASRPEPGVCHAVTDDHRPLPYDSPLRRGRVFLRTSGSLGGAKLVAHTHDGLLENARNGVRPSGRLGIGSADRVLIPVPIAHMFGLGAAFLPALFAGASISFLKGANALTFFERELQFLPTIAFLTPSLCATLLRPRESTQHYRHVVIAGDKLSSEHFRRAETIFGRVLNLYGSTEMGMVCAADAVSADGPRETTVGRALPGVELRLVVQGSVQAESGATGELQCAHPHGFEGYVDGEGQLQSAERWYDTRDLARFHPGGFLELLGRSDHALKRNGRLVILAEVEQALERLPGVARAAAVISGQTLRGRGIVAFCTPHSEAKLDPASLRRRCLTSLPGYAVPDELRVLAALPLLPSGKIDRQALKLGLPT